MLGCYFFHQVIKQHSVSKTFSIIKPTRKEHTMEFSDDFNDDEFMNASPEEWSKPSTPEPRPAAQPEPTDRWGSPISDRRTSSDPGRWTSEPTPTPASGTGQKGGSKWWIILIVALVVLCLCACLVMIVFPLLGLTAFSLLILGVPL